MNTVMAEPHAASARAALGVAVLLGLACVLSPLTFLVLICLASVAVADAKCSWIFLLASCLLFVLLNLSKDLEGDLVAYTNLQLYLQDRLPLVLFSVDELRLVSGTYRITEFGFYAPLWLLSNVFPDSEDVIPVAATLVIYIATFFGLVTIAKVEGWNRRLTLIVVFFVFFAAINFVQSTHLVRQYVSASLAFCAFALFANHRIWASLATALAACSVHNGTILVVINFALAAALFPYEGRARDNPWIFILRATVLVSVLASSVAAIVFHEIGHIGTEDKNIAIWHYIASGSLFSLAFTYSRAHGPQTRTYYYITVAFALVYVLSATFFLLGFKTQALRYFAYLEWAFGLMVAAILCSIPRWRLGLYLSSRLAVCGVATFVFLMRIQGAAWSYGPGRTDLFVKSLFGVVEFLGK